LQAWQDHSRPNDWSADAADRFRIVLYRRYRIGAPNVTMRRNLWQHGAMIRLAALLVLASVTAASAQPEPTRAPQPAWVASALKFVPPGKVAGHAIRTDAAALTGILPVFPANADDPKSPGSSFDIAEVLVVTLQRSGDFFEAVSATVRLRQADDVGPLQSTADRDLMQQFEDWNAKLAANAAKLPAGTVPCELGAYSIDRGALNVRAEPSVKARVLGTLPPRYKFRSKSEAAPPEGYTTEFKIIGFKDGWFLIEGAEPPGKKYEHQPSDYPKTAPKPYPGRGWVAANKVGANFANGATRMGGLFQAPNADAAWSRVVDRHGNEIGPDSSPDRILACSGLWALVEKSGQRGWWRHLCSNQVTNCS